MITFKSELEQPTVEDMTFPNVTITISSEASLPSVVEAFESYLRAVGYHFEGHLDFVNDDGQVIEEEENV